VQQLQEVYLGEAADVYGDEGLVRVLGLAPAPYSLKLADALQGVVPLAPDDEDALGGLLAEVVLQTLQVGIDLFIVEWLFDDEDDGKADPEPGPGPGDTVKAPVLEAGAADKKVIGAVLIQPA